MEDENPMSYFEAAIVTMFGVILPTVDVVSDFWLIGALFSGIIIHVKGGWSSALSIWRNSTHVSNPVLFIMYNTLLVVYGKPQERRRLRANEDIATVTIPGLAAILMEK